MSSFIAAFNGHRRVPAPANEPIRSYAPGLPERASLKARLKTMAAEKVEMPLIIGGKEVKTGSCGQSVMPHAHAHVLGEYHKASGQHVLQAVDAARVAQKEWANWSFDDRAAVILKAAELLTTSWRDTINAATMLGQSKTAFQAEIDSACEIIDFWRFNVHYGQELLDEQPLSDHSMWNQLEYRALEGFVYAVTPFNFTSIAANLPTAPALMGNTVVWKPASSAIYSAWQIVKLLEAAGLPPGVVNFVPGPGRAVGDPALASPDLAGLHFTGSTEVFHGMWRTVGEHLDRYRSYPRLVGETGGKDFVFVHPSADVDAAATALVRGAFEYQGQKCSAASRAYVPEGLWPQLRERLLGMTAELKVGEVEDFTNFMGALIDREAFERVRRYVGIARASSQAKILCGGRADDARGFFVEPTVVETVNPRFQLMEEEIFGPVLTVYVYADIRLDEALELCLTTSPYGLTGAIFARDREAIADLTRRFRDAAGNFYVNDKPTGAVVGQQPFGGARASGTNDKAGSMANLLRWTSQRSIKETFDPPTRFEYPSMRER